LITEWNQVIGLGNVFFSSRNGVWQASFSAPGVYVLRATATDIELTAHDDISVTVFAPLDPPEIIITSPVDSQTITAPVPVIGSINSPILTSYALQLRLRDDTSPWTTLNSGTVPVING